MNRWKKYYSSPIQPVERFDYLKQVGHTLNGKSINNTDFRLMIDQIRCELSIKNDDIVLDLCCGNGYITKELALACDRVVGVDFSSNLIQIANEDHCPDNADYVCMDVTKLDTTNLLLSGPYNKILLYAGLQHISKKDLEPLLRKILELSAPKPTILFGFVPDRNSLSDFYDTSKKRCERMMRILKGTELMKTWWDKKFIRRIARKLGLQCAFHDLDARLQATQYRFDVVMNVIDD